MRSARRIAGAVLAVAGLAVFGWYVARHLQLDLLRPHLTPRTAVALLLSAIAYATTVPLAAVAWKRLLSTMRIAASFRRLCAIQMTTQIGKYLPGNVGHLIGRSALAMRSGLPAGAVANTMVVEVLLLLATGVVVAVATAALSQPGLAQLRMHGTTLALVAVACVAGIAVLPFANRGLLRFVARIAPQAASLRTAPMQLRPADLALVIALYAGAYLANGLSAAIIARGLWPDAIPDIALLTAAFAVAWVAGFVTPGAPAGIGIREALLVLMLGPAMGASSATLLVLALRLATILGDILSFLVGTTLLSRSDRDFSPSQDVG